MWGTGQTLQFPLQTGNGTSIVCFRNIPKTLCVYKQAGGGGFCLQTTPLSRSPHQQLSSTPKTTPLCYSQTFNCPLLGVS